MQRTFGAIVAILLVACSGPKREATPPTVPQTEAQRRQEVTTGSGVIRTRLRAPQDGEYDKKY